MTSTLFQSHLSKKKASSLPFPHLNSKSDFQLPLHFPMDDRELDDAELWAVIDSAAARSRKPLLPAVPYTSPAPPKPSRNPRIFKSAAEEFRVPSEGEVVQEDRCASSYRRPQKTARLEDRGMVVVRQPPRPSPLYMSPPEPGRFLVKEVTPVVESPPPDHLQRVSLTKEVSPMSERWQSEEKENMRHSLSGQFPSVSTFKQYQNAAMAILEKTDYTMISGSPYIKKTGWRKISFFFNLSYEIKDKSIEFDENRNVQRAEFVIRAYMQGGRFSDGWGSCERREKRFLKPNHDIPSTAETRAKNKACQDLLGIGEYRSDASNGSR